MIARSGRPRWSIGVKMGALLGALLAVLAVTSAALVIENRETARGFDAVLNQEMRQGQLARQLQVASAGRVQEWKALLLDGSDPGSLARHQAALAAQEASVHDLYRKLVAAGGPDPVLATQLRQWAASERAADAVYARALDAFVASRGRDHRSADRVTRDIDQPVAAQIDRVVAGLESRTVQRLALQEQRTTERQRLALVLAGCLFVLVGSLMILALIRIVRPIRDLTRQADAVATYHLPSAVAEIKGMRPEDDAPTLPPFTVQTSDEMRELARALTALQESALSKAVEQRRSERETADMLVNLGRRNQNLLGRMLSYVSELERREQDPDILAQLFRLDHATTRIRRNAESMLVLAGAAQTRTWSRPVPVIDVVRAALSEIEDYARVDLHHVEDSLVVGSAVADVVHLVAELVENATHFSPPTTHVTVIGQRVGDGYRLRIVDSGVGMTERELSEANQRITRVDGGWADTKLLGLVVVGRLARRRGIEVVLESSSGRGVTASVQLPAALLAAVPNRAGAAALTGDLPLTGGLRPVPGAAGAGGGQPRVVDPMLVEPRAASRVVELHAVGSRSAEARDTEPRVAEPRVAEVEQSVPAPSPPLTPIPGGLGGPPRLGVVPDLKRTIDVTDAATAADRPLTGPVPVQWFKDGSRGGGAGAPAAADAPAGAPAAGSRQGVPRRVRGAQLPDLGAAAPQTAERPEEGPGAPESLRWQLRSFQLDVLAARRAITEAEPASDQPEGGER